MKWLRLVPKNRVVVHRKLIDGLYKNLASKEEENERLRDVIAIAHERNTKNTKQIDDLAKRINDIKEKYSGIFDENLSLAAECAALKAENERLKEKVKRNNITPFVKREGE